MDTIRAELERVFQLVTTEADLRAQATTTWQAADPIDAEIPF